MIKVYCEYKTARFKWFEKIPSHWLESKISYLFEIGRGRVISMLDINPEGKYPVYSSQTKDDGCMGFIDTYDFDDNILTWTTDGANAGTVFIRSGKFNCTNVCGTLKPKKTLDLKYFLYYLQHITQFYKRPDTNGAKIMNNEMAAVYSLFPPVDEQTQIARFLDYKTAIIDELIRRKEKQIELLKEKRQSIINEVVTKGLNPNAKMKDSGIEWLGEIPEEWKMSKSKYVTELITDGAHISPDTSSEDYPFISTVDLERGNINWDNCLKTSKDSYEYLVRTGCKPILNDILYSKDGTIGKTVVIEEEKEFVVASSLIIIRPKTNLVNPFYLEFLLRSNIVTYQIERLLSGVALRRISLEKFSNLQFILPPMEEQQKLLEYLGSSQRIFLNTIDSIENQIEKLKEYRQSLISEAVTGKIDVRDWEPKIGLN